LSRTAGHSARRPQGSCCQPRSPSLLRGTGILRRPCGRGSSALGEASAVPWIAAAKVDANRLVFEITETAAIQSIEHAQQLRRQLSDLGCEIALDDFGSGFCRLLLPQAAAI
jgi:hypothetical protein